MHHRAHTPKNKLTEISDCDIEGIPTTLAGRLDLFVTRHYDLMVSAVKVCNASPPRYRITGADCPDKPGNYQCIVAFHQTWATRRQALHHLRVAARRTGTESRIYVP